jgi:hypothetical protein
MLRDSGSNRNAPCMEQMLAGVTCHGTVLHTTCTYCCNFVCHRRNVDACDVHSVPQPLQLLSRRQCRGGHATDTWGHQQEGMMACTVPEAPAKIPVPGPPPPLSCQIKGLLVQWQELQCVRGTCMSADSGTGIMHQHRQRVVIIQWAWAGAWALTSRQHSSAESIRAQGMQAEQLLSDRAYKICSYSADDGSCLRAIVHQSWDDG